MGRKRKEPVQTENQEQMETTKDEITQTEPVQESVDIPVKKPRKKKKGDAEEPDLGGATIDGAPIPKPKKDRKKPKKRKPELTVEGIKSSVLGVHAMLAIYAPGAMISEANAQIEATAIKNVIDQYDLSWLSKYAPIIMLGATVAYCEIPTIAAIKEEREKRLAVKKNGGKLVKPPVFTNKQTFTPIKNFSEGEKEHE